jgi:NTP pyrophosphatase (non-canonical NTP hydrolase)
MNDLEDIRQRLLEFRDLREWKQFHDPKNLAEAISIEAGELLEHFLWKTVEESKNLTESDLSEIGHEIADIFIFVVYLSTELQIDLLESVKDKIQLNDKKYPTEKSRGTSKKYQNL